MGTSNPRILTGRRTGQRIDKHTASAGRIELDHRNLIQQILNDVQGRANHEQSVTIAEVVPPRSTCVATRYPDSPGTATVAELTTSSAFWSGVTRDAIGIEAGKLLPVAGERQGHDIGWIAELPPGPSGTPYSCADCESVGEITRQHDVIDEVRRAGERVDLQPRAGVDDPPSPRGSAGHEETSMTVDLEAHSHQTRSTRIDHEALSGTEARGINGTVRTRTEVRNAAWTDGDAFRQKTNGGRSDRERLRRLA